MIERKILYIGCMVYVIAINNNNNKKKKFE